MQSKDNLEEKELGWMSYMIRIKTYRSTIIKTVWNWYRGRHTDQ